VLFGWLADFARFSFWLEQHVFADKYGALVDLCGQGTTELF
jgi:hypothetical protein